jgi:hypothetical protein
VTAQARSYFAASINGAIFQKTVIFNRNTCICFAAFICLVVWTTCHCLRARTRSSVNVLQFRQQSYKKELFVAWSSCVSACASNLETRCSYPRDDFTQPDRLQTAQPGGQWPHGALMILVKFENIKDHFLTLAATSYRLLPFYLSLFLLHSVFIPSRFGLPMFSFVALLSHSFVCLHLTAIQDAWAPTMCVSLDWCTHWTISRGAELPCNFPYLQFNF